MEKNTKNPKVSSGAREETVRFDTCSAASGAALEKKSKEENKKRLTD